MGGSGGVDESGEVGLVRFEVAGGIRREAFRLNAVHASGVKRSHKILIESKGGVEFFHCHNILALLVVCFSFIYIADCSGFTCNRVCIYRSGLASPPLALDEETELPLLLFILCLLRQPLPVNRRAVNELKLPEIPRVILGVGENNVLAVLSEAAVEAHGADCDGVVASEGAVLAVAGYLGDVEDVTFRQGL